MSASPQPAAAPQPFPRVFWTANVTELFERGAYYAMASFVVIYLGQLGLGDYWPSTLNSLLWGLVYFLPILSGTIADAVGFRKSLLVAFVLLAAGYFLMGYPVFLGGATLNKMIEKEVTAGASVVIPVVLAILLIGAGGSVIKPCISGTVQKVSGARATLAFAIFYMVINMGSLVGRAVSYPVRTGYGIAYIFAVSMAFSVVAFLVVFFTYRDPEQAAGTPAKPKRSISEILVGMVRVLGNKRFALFLLVSAGFNFLYSQVYNVLPLYVKKVVETDPKMEIYTMANPFVIVCFQLLVTKYFGKMRPIRSIVVGILIISASMAVNLVPIYMAGGVRTLMANWFPIGSVFIVLTVALIAFAELFASARTYEYIGALAPKGQEGLFLGYANLPMAIGSLVGGPVGAFIFNRIMCNGATKLDSGLLELQPTWATAGWMVLMVIGLASAASMWWFNHWVEKQDAAKQPA